MTIKQGAVVAGVALLLSTITPPRTYAATILNVTIDSSAQSGIAAGLVFGFTADAPSFNVVNILNFSTNGAMGFPDTQGGLVSGDLILGLNPSPFTTIEGDFFFNELTVNMTTFGSQTTFTLQLTENPPKPGGGLPDQFAFFILGANGLPLFPTDDPFGTDALFVIDITGGAGGALSVFGPATLTGPNNVLIKVPGGGGGGIPEPSVVVLWCLGIPAVIRARRRLMDRSARSH
jgi:hypothetical protein